MKNIKILFPDSLHFHERNFKSLINFIKKTKITHTYVTEYNNLKALYGNLKDQKTFLLAYYDQLKRLDKEELFNFKVKAINLFQISKAETLSFVISKKNWYSTEIFNDDLFIFDKLFKEDKKTLLLNLSMAYFWIDFWFKKLRENYNFTHCIIFSNSLTYAKALTEILKISPTKVIVVENFFTGNDFYFEEKYEHIANNSDIKFKNILNRYELPEDILEYENLKIKAYNKVFLSKNKNVTQPINSNIENFINFNNENKTILILGQVLNDFSILETNLKNINSVYFYKSLITKIIKMTNLNIVFKSHPWEKKKININDSLTYKIMFEFLINNFTIEERERILITEDFNLTELLKNTNYTLALSSQSLLEALFNGKKVIQFGKAFFGEHGFTYDYSNIDQFIKDFHDNKINEHLTLSEVINFERYLIIILQYHLFSVFPSGETKLNKFFESQNNNKLIKYQKKKLIH